MNDQDRREWINNDEGLHDWWRRSRKCQSDFIKEHRVELDRLIAQYRDGKKPMHDLKYGKGD